MGTSLIHCLASFPQTAELRIAPERERRGLGLEGWAPPWGSGQEALLCPGLWQVEGAPGQGSWGQRAREAVGALAGFPLTQPEGHWEELAENSKNVSSSW